MNALPPIRLGVPQEASPTFLGLPRELRLRIFRHLSLEDLSRTALVCLTLYGEVKEMLQIKGKEALHSLRVFIPLINAKLQSKKFTKRRKELDQVLSGNLEIRSLFSYRDSLISSLYKLREGKLNFLKSELSPPFPCKNIFDLALTRKRIEVMRRSYDEPALSEALFEITVDLCSKDKVECALMASKSIDSRDQRSAALRAVILALLQKGQVPKALKIARIIPDKYEKQSSIAEILYVLCRLDRVETAQVLAQEFDQDIEEILNEKKDCHTAFKLALKKVGSLTPSSTFLGLARASGLSEAVTFALSLPHKQDQTTPLEQVVAELVDEEDTLNRESNAKFLYELFEELNEVWGISAIVAFFQSVPHREDIPNPLEQIFIGLIEKKDLDQALDFARTLPWHWSKLLPPRPAHLRDCITKLANYYSLTPLVSTATGALRLGLFTLCAVRDSIVFSTTLVLWIASHFFKS